MQKLIALVAAGFLVAALPSPAQKEKPEPPRHETIEGNIRSFDLAENRFVIEFVPERKKGDTTTTLRLTDKTTYRLDDNEAAKDDAIRPGLRARVTVDPAKPHTALKVHTYTSTSGEPRSRHSR